MDTKKKVWMQRRRRISEIIEAGTADDIVSRCYDIFSTLVTLTNVVVTVLYTFDKMERVGQRLPQFIKESRKPRRDDL